MTREDQARDLLARVARTFHPAALASSLSNQTVAAGMIE